MESRQFGHMHDFLARDHSPAPLDCLPFTEPQPSLGRVSGDYSETRTTMRVRKRKGRPSGRPKEQGELGWVLSLTPYIGRSRSNFRANLIWSQSCHSFLGFQGLGDHKRNKKGPAIGGVLCVGVFS